MELSKIGDNQVVASENFEKMQFGIAEENIGLILETLRSKMYSNPIAAICREISSNCRDSHREAGKGNMPIEVSIKDGDVFMGVNDDVNITINFIDRGVGISPDRIKNIYLNFGASTKRSDNSQTGGFGYGAKTPLAYSDSFAVTTIYEGKKYTYFFSIGENRRGDAYLISEVDTTEGNGTTVSIPLKDEDRDKFEYELMRATYFWDVLPRFTGNFSESFKRNFTERDSNITFKKEKFFMVGERTPAAFRKFGFIIDGIYYDYTTTKELEAFKNLVESTIRNSRLYLRFNTGEVSISTNREALFYDKKTIDLILKNSKGYVTTLKKEYIRAIKKYDGSYYNFSCDMAYNSRYGAVTDQGKATIDLYKTLKGFENKFIVACNKKYFDIRFPSNQTRHNSQEEHFVQAVDSNLQFQVFERFIAGDKRGRRSTDRFANVKDGLIKDSLPIYKHNNFLERDSIKKNLTIFGDKSRWKDHRKYWVMQIPDLGKAFMAKAKTEFRNRASEIKKKRATIDPKGYHSSYELDNLKSQLKQARSDYRAALHRRSIIKRMIEREIPFLRSQAIPTYDSIPETKISRKASDLAKNAFRAVQLTMAIQKKRSNKTRNVKSYEPHGEYKEVKLSELSSAILIPTKSGNVYQMQQEVRQVIVETSYIEYLSMLFSEMFPKEDYIYFVFAKANDYQFMKTVSNETRKIYRVEDLIKKAKTEFDEIRVNNLFKQYQKLKVLANTNPNDYNELNSFCESHKNKIHPIVGRQIKFESKVNSLRKKYLDDHSYGRGYNIFDINLFTKEYEDSKGRMDKLSTPITGVSEWFIANKDYNALVKLFRDSFKKTCTPLKTGKSLKMVFRRHYGRFTEDLISNYYRAGSSRTNNTMRLGILKLMRECDEKYETFFKKQ